jgi:hypothetical protein
VRSSFKDITGQRFAKMEVLALDRVDQNKYGTKSFWLCRCECGVQKVVRKDHLRLGRVLSCGCHRAQLKTNLSHGEGAKHTLTKEYRAWGDMKKRCLDSNHRGFKHYGGRGITICDRWLSSYENFLEDMGRAPEGTTIDRINVNGNYEPGNCRWATAKMQALNKRNTLGLMDLGKRISRDEALALFRLTRRELAQWISNSRGVSWAWQ